MAQALLLPLILSLAVLIGRQGIDDAELRAAVERFFAMQEAEDVEGYLGLWSKTASRPALMQLRFVFESGDDKFSDISIVRTTPLAAGVRVRVSATRERTSPSQTPGGAPRIFRSKNEWTLLYVREGTEWKLLREGGAMDGLIDALLESKTPEERETALAAEPELVSDLLLMSIARRAAQSAQMSAYADAQRAYELMRDVARRLGNTKIESEALQNLANSMYFLRNLHGALQFYEERLALERTRDDQEGIASSLLGAATVRYSLAEYGTALAAYREALAIQERRADEAAIATTLISTGNIAYLQGDFPAAIADYIRSRDIYERTLNKTGEADALEGMGRVFLAQGDYLAALEAFGDVLTEAKERNNRAEQGSALLSIGDVHFRLANLDNARAALDEARLHFEAVKHLAYVGRSWQALALVDLVAGRFPLAEEEYRKGAASCTAAEDKECSAGAIVGLAFAQTAQDKFPEGIASYKKAIDAFTALKRREPAARAGIGLAQALAGSKDFKASLTAASHARSEAEALVHDDVLWRARVAEANALRHLRERPRAIAAAEAAVAAADRLLETAKVRPSSPVSRETSAAFATLALLQAEGGDAAAAFESAERMRTHDLRVLLAPGERDISRGMTDAERAEERTLAVELVSLHAQLYREKTLPKPDAARVARLEARVAETTDARTAQQQRLFERLPSLKVWRGQMAPATRAEVDGLLPDTRTVLLQFVVGEETLLVIAARRGEQGVQFSTLFEPASRKALAERVAKLLQPTTLKDAAAWTLAANELIPGLAAVVGTATRAIVIPHEVLWRVPFEAFPTANGTVADTTSILYAPSATALVRAQLIPQVTDAAPAVSGSVVAVVAPQLAPPVVQGLAQTAPGWTLRDTEGADREVKTITAAADPERTVVIRGDAATEAALRDQMLRADLLHLAAPFRVNGASPLFSPVLLAPDAANDGALESREIMNLDLGARLTILSDGTAMTMRDAADEVPAVAWAWRAAGVRAVLMRRWVSDDAQATELLAELHARLRAGDAPESALQAARAKFRQSSFGAVPHHWAAWILIAQ